MDAPNCRETSLPFRKSVQEALKSDLAHTRRLPCAPQTPFQASSLEQVLERVKAAEWAFHGRRWAMVSEGAKDLVARLLRRDPGARLSAQEALEHPWLRRYEAQSQALLQEAVASFKVRGQGTAGGRRSQCAHWHAQDYLVLVLVFSGCVLICHQGCRAFGDTAKLPVLCVGDVHVFCGS